MSYRDLLLHVDTTEVGMKRAEFAIDFAQAQKAHLTGVAFVATRLDPYYCEPGILPTKPPEYFDTLRGKTEEVFSALKEKTTSAGVSFESRLCEGLPVDFLRQLSIYPRTVDMTILGQPGSADIWGSYGELITRVLFTAKQPVLIVPKKGQTAANPKTILAAWDGSAEAAYAFQIAKPFMVQAERVIVCMADPEQNPLFKGRKPGEEMVRHLRCHDINVELRHGHPSESKSNTVGDLMMTRVTEEKADLIVMGAYHHSRLRQSMVGGATQSIIENMPVPTLMAH